MEAGWFKLCRLLAEEVRAHRVRAASGESRLPIQAIAYCMHLLQWSKVLEAAKRENDEFYSLRMSTAMEPILAGAGNGERLVQVYRRTNRPTEVNTVEETGHLLTDAAQRPHQKPARSTRPTSTPELCTFRTCAATPSHHVCRWFWKHTYCTRSCNPIFLKNASTVGAQTPTFPRPWKKLCPSLP